MWKRRRCHRQAVRTSGSTAAAAIVLVSAGCVATSEAGDGATNFADHVGSEWDAFASAVLLPLLGAGIALLAFWLVLVLIARVAVAIPWWKRPRLPRRLGVATTWIGILIIVVAGVAFVASPAFAADLNGELARLGVSAGAGLVGAAVLSVGMATRPQLDARVFASDGSENTAWTIDLLTQMRRINADDPRGRVGTPTSADLNELITVADKSGSGLAAVLASVMQVVFNSAPWNLQVTMLDESTGAAVLRRNGVLIEEADLQLDWTSDGDQHRKLLTLAAAFGAMTLAGRYVDIRGFYLTERWRSIGFVELAHSTAGAERTHYLKRALKEDPNSIVAEYAHVYDRVYEANTAASLHDLMKDLEPLINKAAALSCECPVLEDVPQRKWDKLPANHRREPRMLLLRLMAAYTTAARNWEACIDVDGVEQGGEQADEQRDRIQGVLRAYVTALTSKAVERELPAQTLARLRQQAALSCRLLLDDDPPGSPVAEWFGAATRTTDVDIRYSYVCYLAVRPTHTDEDQEIITAVRFARLVEEYRDWMAKDPELCAMAKDPKLRASVNFTELRDEIIPGTSRAWEIERFAFAEASLAALGVREPEQLSFVKHDLRKSLGLTAFEYRHLVDGATILSCARGRAERILGEAELLRAIRYLLDDGGHSVMSLKASWRRSAPDLTASVGASVYWMPERHELANVEKFLSVLVARLP